MTQTGAPEITVEQAQNEEAILRARARAEQKRLSYLTVAQVATITGRTGSMIRHYVRDGRLPAIPEDKWPYRLLISPIDVASLFANRPYKKSGWRRPQENGQP